MTLIETFIPLLLNQKLNAILAPLIEPLTKFLVNIFNVQAETYPIDILRVIVAIPVLIYASYCDIKERKVKDVVWIPLYAFGTLFIAYHLYTGNFQLLAPWIAGNLLFAFLLGYILYWTQLFGGADRKALIGLAILFPTYPLLITFPLVTPPVLDYPMNAFNMFSLTIMANTSLVAVIYIGKSLVHNIKDGFNINRPGLMLTAKRVKLNEAPQKHGKILPTWTFKSNTRLGRFLSLLKGVKYGIDTEFLLDYVEWHNSGSDEDMAELSDIDNLYIEKFIESDANKNEDGEKYWKETMDIEKAEKELETLLQKDEIWMTPGIPFIVPMTIGLLISLTFGDITYWLITLIN